MAFSWVKQIEKAEKKKVYREKRMASHNISFLAKFSVSKAKRLVE